METYPATIEINGVERKVDIESGSIALVTRLGRKQPSVSTQHPGGSPLTCLSTSTPRVFVRLVSKRRVIC